MRSRHVRGKDVEVALSHQILARSAMQRGERLVDQHPAMLRVLHPDRIRYGVDHGIEKAPAALDLPAALALFSDVLHRAGEFRNGAVPAHRYRSDPGPQHPSIAMEQSMLAGEHLCALNELRPRLQHALPIFRVNTIRPPERLLIIVRYVADLRPAAVDVDHGAVGRRAEDADRSVVVHRVELGTL